MASTRPLMSCVFAVIEGARPSSLRVAVVTGPMLAALQPSGHGKPQLEKVFRRGGAGERHDIRPPLPESRLAPATSSVSASVL